MKALALVIFVFSTSSISRELPDYIPICKRGDSDFSGCIKKATATIQPYFAKGIKELNIPPFEPLIIPMIKLEQGTNAVNYKAALTDIKIYGLSKYKFQQVVADFINAKTLLCKVDLPQVNIVADYNIGGNVLILPIKGSGEMTANLTNSRCDVMVKGDLMKKKGQEYFQAKEVRTNFHFGNVKAYFDNLFDGDALLGMTTNNFLNNNAKDILNEIKPALEAITNMLVEDIINKIFRSASVDKLFPK